MMRRVFTGMLGDFEEAREKAITMNLEDLGNPIPSVPKPCALCGVLTVLLLPHVKH